jgi:hypothetical protein
MGCMVLKEFKVKFRQMNGFECYLVVILIIVRIEIFWVVYQKWQLLHSTWIVENDIPPSRIEILSISTF